jgi:hypothetical protein
VPHDQGCSDQQRGGRLSSRLPVVEPSGETGEVVASVCALLLAHQGGWDEMLLVAAPIAALAFILWLANRRAGRALEKQAGDDDVAADDHDAGTV